MHRRNLYLLLIGNILTHIGTGITMLAIPWLIVKNYGAKEYGYVSIATILISILILPHIGHIIDKFSRKNILIFVLVFGATMTTVMTIVFINNPDSIYPLAGLCFLGTIVYNFQFPTLFAFIQEVFPGQMYNRINGLMEIQSQFAMMISGGLGAILLEKVALSTILIIDISSYIVALILFSFLRYDTAKLSPLDTKKRPSMWEGFHFMFKFPHKYFFLLGSLFPFTVVKVFNYLLPIHIAGALYAGAEVFGYSEILWAIGAMTAGVIIPICLNKFPIQKVILFCFIIFTTTILVNALNFMVWLFVVNVFFMGWGNASIRVSRNTFMMQVIENKQIGRVNTSLLVISNIMNISLTAIFANIVEYTGSNYCFFLLFLLLILCLYAMLRLVQEHLQKIMV